MRLDDIRSHFITRAPWLDPDPYKTVDKIVWGDPERDIHTCLVTWISSLGAVREAVKRGVDLLITHEPTFYTHSHDPEIQFVERTGRGVEKLRFIREHGLCILRLHDTWDRWPGIGIPWAWAQYLGLGTKPVRMGGGQFHGTHHRYDIPPTPLREFARRVAARTAALGEPCIQVVGDPD
jgi:putative NIF3 family GTP cyclohydrolase 1 type 2